jgi:hypothetical protein
MTAMDRSPAFAPGFNEYPSLGFGLFEYSCTKGCVLGMSQSAGQLTAVTGHTPIRIEKNAPLMFHHEKISLLAQRLKTLGTSKPFASRQ